MTTLEQVKTYVQNHLVAVVATSVVALVAIATTIYQTRKNEHQKGPLSIFNLKSYEIKKLFGSKEEKTSGEEYENNEEEPIKGDENENNEEEPVKVKIKGNENQMQQPLVDEAKDQH